MENLTAFTVDEVTVALRSFKKSSSAGPSRMRPCHILNLFQAKTANRLFTVLGSLTTKFANYGFPSSLSPLLCGASLFALEKPAGGIRPIACGDLLRRLTSKLVLSQVLPIVPQIAPCSAWVGSPCWNGNSVPQGIQSITFVFAREPIFTFGRS